jgi:hypothetical protein
MIVIPGHALDTDTKIELVQSEIHANSGTIEIKSDDMTYDKTE